MAAAEIDAAALMRNPLFLCGLPAIRQFLLLVSTASIACGAAIVVDSTTDADDALPGDGICGTNLVAGHSAGPCTLRAAIEEANLLPGADSIIFNIPTTDDGYNPQTGSYTLGFGVAPPDITEALTISGSDPTKIIVTRPPNGRQFHLFNITATGTVNLKGITIKRGDVANIGDNKGGGVQNAGNGTVNVTNVVFDTNHAITGGAFCNSAGGVANFSQVLFKNNYATFGGCVANAGNGTITIDSCTFDPNSAQNGAGIANTGSSGIVNITGSTFSNNTSGVNGGAIYSASGTLNITGATISNNGLTGSPTSSQCFGGGIYIGGGTATIIGTTISGNKCMPPLPPSPFTSPVILAAGGGIANAAGTLVVTNCTISGNMITAPVSGYSSGPAASAAGAGIYSTGQVTITGSSAANNAAIGGDASYSSSVSGIRGGDALGGGLYLGGTASVTNCTFAGNTAKGGAAKANPGGVARGGGIYTSAPLNLSNTTIVSNSATAGSPVGTGTEATGGGVFVSSSVATNVKSTLIAANGASTSGPDVFGAFSSQGYNLFGKLDGSNGLGISTDLVGTASNPLDPKLDSNGLQSNGGPTQTIALLLGSPAIDHGTSNGLGGNLGTDQRGAGFPRVFDDPSLPNANDGADIGAFELQTGAPAPTPTATPLVRLGNISTRLRVETGDNVLIGGFIITGTEPKKVIIRAIGPSLPFAGKLVNPTLELRDGSGALLESNDDWVNSPNKQAIIDSTIPPSNDLESAIVATLPANNTGYTAIVRGVNAGTGIGVVEAYDLDTAANSRLANISTRGFVQTGDNVLIAGTIIVGQIPQKVLIRAIGPSLSIAGKMENPTLELRDSNGALLQANDNWVDSADKQAIMDSTIPPTNDLESAIVATLPANAASYTAIVRGVNDTTGIGVVEVYALP
jgi:CSLREA domain-containing protein